MYNIYSHYEYIFKYVSNHVKQPVVAYLHPFGSTNYENLECLHSNGDGSVPLFLCYDQEPITDNLYHLIQQIKKKWGRHKSIILINTETESEDKDSVLKDFNLIDCYYFFHALIASDWYRQYYYNIEINKDTRSLEKKYITFNRITGNSRAYRSLFLAELQNKNLVKDGFISYSDTCPIHGHYSETIYDLKRKHKIIDNYLHQCKSLLDQINFPLRIDNQNSSFIENDSQTLGPIEKIVKSFLFIVTETCFWEKKKHLTEKIFKPIVSKNPFVLLGCANNLKYLQTYGFKTFDKWWDESYDDIEDPLERLNSVMNIIKFICNKDIKELEIIYREMQEVLDYNFNWFFSREFINLILTELKINLNEAISQL